jgi:hypothetical protein
VLLLHDVAMGAVRSRTMRAAYIRIMVGWRDGVSRRLVAGMPAKGLPFLTALEPSERYASSRRRRHKKLPDLGRQVLLQKVRWLPDRQIIGVTDSSYTAIDLLNALRGRVCMITRLRLDARQFDPAAWRRPGTIGRPRVIGTRQASLADRLTNLKTRWRRVRVTGWYGRGERTVEILSGTALWHHPGRLVPIRYVMVRDVVGQYNPPLSGRLYEIPCKTSLVE